MNDDGLTHVQRRIKEVAAEVAIADPPLEEQVKELTARLAALEQLGGRVAALEALDQTTPLTPITTASQPQAT